MISSPAVQTTAGIVCNVSVTDSDTTIPIAVAVVIVGITLVVHCTVAADISISTETQE